jgi:hypothetical protein
LPSGVTWKVDDVVIRTSTISPKGPMRFNLNMWVPASDWRAAYDGSLNYTTSVSENKTYTMLVDWVRVDSLTDISTSIVDTKQPEQYVFFYPNPAHDLIYFNSSEDINISIYNLSGNMILNKRKVSNGSLSIAGLLPGIYFVRCEKNGIINNSKLVVR